MKKRYIDNENCYHIFNRSIAKYTIFNEKADFLRFLDILRLYRFANFSYKYSKFLELDLNQRQAIINDLEKSSPVLVEIVCYCLMPTHFHLILRQKNENGISDYMSKVSNCYSRYFNVKHKRKGPLWESRFNDVQITNNDILLHVTRYLHLNATSAGLVRKPENWPYSSYLEYISETNIENKICTFNELLDIKPKTYKKFVEDRIDYQKKLSKIKKLLSDNYSG